MRFMWCGWVVAVVLGAREPARAVESPSERVLVLQLAATGIAPEVGKNLSEVFASTIREAMPKVEVLGQSEIDSMLAMERQRDLLGCADNISCLAEIGGALGADHLAVGSIGKVGSTYTLNLKLLDTKAAKTDRHISKEILGSEDLLLEATRQWGAHLVDPSRAAGLGYVTILGQGEVFIDGQSRGHAPVERLALAAGSHLIEWVEASGARHKRDIRVAPYVAIELRPVEGSQPRIHAAGFSARPHWRASAHAGLLGKISAASADLGQPEPDTLAYGGAALFGGRLGYLFDTGLQPFVALEIRKVIIKAPREGLLVDAPDAVLQQFASGLGLAYSTAGRLRLVPSLAVEVIQARVISDDSIDGKAFRDRVADGFDLSGDSGVHVGLHLAADVSYAVVPEFDVGARLGVQVLPQVWDHVTYTANAVVEVGF